MNCEGGVVWEITSTMLQNDRQHAVGYLLRASSLLFCTVYNN